MRTPGSWILLSVGRKETYMDWMIRHHEAVLLWITAVAAHAAATTCYHAPACGVLLRALAFVLLIAGFVEAIRKEDEYDE